MNKNQLILIKEFTEGGISGYKTKMKDRDALVAIKKMALNKEFDVLIVYKSDRIGRTSDESPLVIKYLNDQGIRVVTCSGEEIKTHTQIDKLMTYLTFWQNESESVKLSERATDYQILQLKNGKYRGGGKKTLPFGYRSNEAYIRYVWLLAYLCQYHKLNPQKDIIGHETLDPKRKIDPSNGLSYSGHTFKGLIADVQKEYDSLCGNNEISEELKKALEILSTKKIEGDVIMNSPMYWESAIQNKEVNFTWLEALIIKTATYLQKI